MKYKFKICCLFILYGLGWFITTLHNFVSCLLGLINPQQFLEYCFNYNTIKNNWFNKTSFGWYWNCTSSKHDEMIKNSWLLRLILRIRFILALPTAFLHCCFHYWCREILKDEPCNVSTYMKRYFKVIKDGYYNKKEKEYYVEEGGQRYGCKC